MKALLVAAAFCCAAVAGPVQAQTEVKMVGFGGATNLPVWVAMDRGLFEKEGLKVTFDVTHGSFEQIRDLMEDKYAFATTSIDNIVAYTEGQGRAKYDNFDLVAIGGVHSGMNSVVSRPEVKTFADIKGKAVAVDAVTSGYATVLYQILKNKGLEKDKDYSVVSVGGTGARVKAMTENKASMAIISSPSDMQLKKKGFNILADAATEIGAYQGSVYAVRRSYAKAHEKQAQAFMRAVVAGHDFVFNNKAGAIEVLKNHTKGLSDEQLDDLYTRMTGPGGLNPKADVNEKGVDMVLRLRSVYGTGGTPDAKPSKYVDERYQNAAAGQK